ncbi:4'-phosphopantetheinyl transferase superfamily protein [Streptomyces sp. NBC_00094]|uniref:4'-phosphopantetheinyl transferase family protein n=1 Tax=Streptomyces sp. NBC_00094 TaxID=2903620 RepID=UPI00224DB01C|nr:4'-phosphopantetheinyl transferase superfamily protein [Streptomyces sp. NBC_00094]MCX5394407.1 4'-phosphopantetheinyl transferase superfamily protein [Streptomyces sp. NBC_00094]
MDPDRVTVLWCTTDGDERTKAHRLLLQGAAALLDVPASEIWVEHEPSGRPFLGGAGKGLMVSVSHARGVLALVLSGSCPVGVDVEVVRRLNAGALARAYLDPVETDWVCALPEAERATGFLWLWTQKESVGKALGQGLRDGGMSRRVPLPENWPPGDTAPPVPRRLPGAPDIRSAAVLVGGGRFVLGVATQGEHGDCGVSVLVRRVDDPPGLPG